MQVIMTQDIVDYILKKPIILVLNSSNYKLISLYTLKFYLTTINSLE